MASEVIKIDEEEITELSNPEKLFHEINLFRIEGCYFSFSRYRKPVAKKLNAEVYQYKLKTAEGEIDLKLTIDINPTYGKPGILAYKILQAILKKYSDYGLPFPEGVPLGQRELYSLVDRKITGSNKQEFEKALKQLRRTGVECTFYYKDQKQKKSGVWETIDFEILNKFFLAGREKGKISQGYFALDPSIVRSLNNRYWFCLNFDRMRGLEPIATAIFKRLFYHFSNLYSDNKNKQFVFTKNFGDVCKYWLGGLSEYKYKSKIEEKFGPHFHAVKKTGLLKSYKIEKNAKGDGFNISFRPGKGFFEDYKRFYGAFPQLSLPFQQSTDKRLFEQPMGLVSYFYQQLFKTNFIEDDILDQTEVDFASDLLSKYSYDQVQAWIDYSIKEAEATNFKMKKFGGIKNFKAAFFSQQEKAKNRAKALEKTQAEQDAQALEFEYNCYVRKCRQEVEMNLSDSDLKKIEAAKTAAQEKALKERHNIALAKLDARQTYNRLIDEKACILSFEDWQATRC